MVLNKYAYGIFCPIDLMLHACINKITNVGQSDVEFEPVGLPTLLKNPLGARWSLLPTLQWVGSWLPTYLASFSPSCQEKRRIMQWEVNRQPLHSEMGTSPLYPSSLGLSWTNATCIPNLMMKEPSEKHTVEPKPCRMNAFICNKTLYSLIRDF
jgi:hypothetical protein